MHPMGAQHSHEEEGLGSEPWPGLQDGFLVKGSYPGGTDNVTADQSLLQHSVFAACKPRGRQCSDREKPNRRREEKTGSWAGRFMVNRPSRLMGQPMDRWKGEKMSGPKPDAGRARPRETSPSGGVWRVIAGVLMGGHHGPDGPSQTYRQ